MAQSSPVLMPQPLTSLGPNIGSEVLRCRHVCINWHSSRSLSFSFRTWAAPSSRTDLTRGIWRSLQVTTSLSLSLYLRRFEISPSLSLYLDLDEHVVCARDADSVVPRGEHTE